MSHSYRKPYTIVPKKSKGKHFYKRLFNKRLRRLPLDILFSYSSFRKYNSSWDIKDYVFYYPEEPKAYRK